MSLVVTRTLTGIVRYEKWEIRPSSMPRRTSGQFEASVARDTVCRPNQEGIFSDHLSPGATFSPTVAVSRSQSDQPEAAVSATLIFLPEIDRYRLSTMAVTALTLAWHLEPRSACILACAVQTVHIETALSAVLEAALPSKPTQVALQRSSPVSDIYFYGGCGGLRHGSYQQTTAHGSFAPFSITGEEAERQRDQ